jgi:hypothetical protein
MDKEFIRTLRQKAQELEKQLEGVRTTIALFDGEEEAEQEEVEPSGNADQLIIPAVYDEGLTWNEKFFFGLTKTPSGFVSDIVKELVKHTDVDEDTLTKRISNSASNLKKKKKVGSKKIGQRVKYFIK